MKKVKTLFMLITEKGSLKYQIKKIRPQKETEVA